MFSSYEELKAAVEERRNDTLTLEVDLGTGQYSSEYEDAKKELAQAKGMKLLTGGQMLSDNIEELEAKVKSLEPERQLVWVRFGRIPLKDWALMLKSQNLSPVEQYDKVLPHTFVGIFGDPDAEEPLSDDYRLVSTGSSGVLPGGTLIGVVQAFMDWQNAGGKVTIHPTKSGRG